MSWGETFCFLHIWGDGQSTISHSGTMGPWGQRALLKMMEKSVSLMILLNHQRYPFWAFMIQFWPLLPPGSPFLLSSEPLQTSMARSSSEVLCQLWWQASRGQRSCLFLLPPFPAPSYTHLPEPNKQLAPGTQESFASGRFWELFRQHVFPFEQLPVSMICCGPICPVGITTTVYSVYF